MRTLLAIGAFALLSACASGPGAPGSTFKDCSDCPEMTVIPAGTFQMGAPDDEPDHGPDEGPVRTVTFAQPYAIGSTEVTRDQYQDLIEATGHWNTQGCLVWTGEKLAFDPTKSWVDPGHPVTGDHPVSCVSWWDATAYTKWLSHITGETYRLPSEAEWEYATRGGTQTAYPFGDEINACDYGNVSDVSAKADVPQWNYIDCDDGVGLGTAPVASYLPNGYGLYDTIGNLWVWQADCYQESFAGAPTDGSAWGSGGKCGIVLHRGGGFSNVFPGHLRAANRSRAPSPHVAAYSLGFRVVRDIAVTD